MAAPRVVILGTAQDGGVPHAGCRCPRCRAARQDPSRVRRVCCLAILPGDGSAYLVDATPDLPHQIEEIPEFSGVFLTHAHMGHLAGLLWLGKEVMAVKRLPVWMGARLFEHVEANEPWATLFRDGHLSARFLVDDRTVELAASLTLTPIAVPHRAEWSETFGFRIAGPRRTVLWLPDIDAFDTATLAKLLDGVDDAWLDGTFWSGEELAGRDMAEVPHPAVSETIEMLAAVTSRTRISFIHLNHTNPLCVRGAPERRLLETAYRDAGIEWIGESPVAEDGDSLTL